MAGNNVEEEYMWSCLLDKESKEFQWMPEEPTNGPSETKNEDENENVDLKPGHRLLIKNAILMPEAAKNDVNVVQIECEGYNKKKVVTPLVVMKGQVDYQRYVDLLVPLPAKIKLLSGDGPVYLNGSHCVDYYGYRGQGEVYAEESEEEEVEMEENGDKEDLRKKLDEKVSKKKEVKVEEESNKSEAVHENADDKNEGKGSKRKASADPTPEKEKKAKTDSSEKKPRRSK